MSKEKHITKDTALTHFVSPDNDKMKYEPFTEELIGTMIGSEHSEEFAGTLHELADDVIGARKFDETYLGHMLSEACIPGMFGHMLAIRLGGNTVAEEVSRKETALEPEAIGFLKDMVGYDKESASGTFTSGGTIAMLTALNVAKKKYQQKFEEEHGDQKDWTKNTPRPKLRVLATGMAHYGLKKNISALGGPYGDIEFVEVGTEGLKMSVQDLEEKVQEAKNDGAPIMAIFAVAGETETGLVDPLTKIAEIAKENDIFTIADGAYGALYKNSRQEQLFEALPEFDAIVMDPHKTLYTPYPNGAVLFKDARDHALLAAGISAPYVKFEKDKEEIVKGLLYQSDKPNLGQKRMEGSASAGSILATVAVSRTLGKDGLRKIYDHTLDNTDHLSERVEESKFLTPAHDPELNLLCFGFSDKAEKALGITDNKQRKAIIDEMRLTLDNGIEGDGGYYFSDTDLVLVDKNGKPETKAVFRACLMHPRTTNEIVDDAITGLEELIQGKIEESNPAKTVAVKQ